MATIQEMMLRAQLLRQETALDSISPERAGGIMYDTLAYINQMQLQGANPLLISKIYASVAAMEADSAPVSDLTGQALRPGQVVVIASADSDNGSVYRYNGGTESRWTVVGKIGNLTPVDSLDSDSTQLPLAAHQGKVLDGKVSALGHIISGGTFTFTTDAAVPYYGTDGTAFTTASNERTELIPVIEGQTFNYNVGTTNNIRMVAFFGADKSLLTGYVAGTNGAVNRQFIVPAGVSYIQFVNKTTYVASPSVAVAGFSGDFHKIAKDYAALYGGQFSFNVNYENPYYGTDGTAFSVDTRQRTFLIPVVEGMRFSYKLYETSNIWMIAAFDSGRQLINASSVAGTNSVQTAEYIVPAGVSYIQATNHSTYNASPVFSVVSLITSVGGLLDLKKPSELWVSFSGNDNNDGLTRLTALRNINTAFERIQSGGVIYLVGDLRQTIDWNKAPLSVKIRNATLYRARILGSNSVACAAVSGYSTVYSLACTWDIADLYGFRTIFDDANGSFPITKPMPQNIGQAYALPCTQYNDRKTRGETTLAGALALMEAADYNCIWQDPNTKTIYVKSVDISLSGKSFEIPARPCTTALSSVGSGKSIIMENVNFAYSLGIGCDFSYFFRVELNNVANYCASNTGMVFREAAAFVNKCISNGNAVDGFAAAGLSSTQDNKTGDNVTYDSCWAAYNYDDGFSHHGGGRAVLNGCLAENSQIGDGFAFVGSSAVEFYNCVARDLADLNGQAGNGYTIEGGDSARDSVTMNCFNCVADNCKQSYYAGPRTGATKINAYCKSCISIGATSFGYGAAANSVLVAVDCTSFGDASVSSGTITKINGTAVN